MSPHRRSALKAIAGLPFLAGVTHGDSAGAHGSRQAPSTPEGLRRMQSIQILRLINTAQRRYFNERGTFSPLADLWLAQSVAAYVASDHAERKGIGRTFFETLSFSGG